MNALLGISASILGTLLIGGVGYEVWHHKKIKELASGKVTVPPGQALDPGMDSYTSQVVSAALQKETDTATLDKLAENLKNAGFSTSAAAVATRSAMVKNQISSGIKSATSTPLTTVTKGLVTSVAGFFTGAPDASPGSDGCPCTSMTMGMWTGCGCEGEV